MAAPCSCSSVQWRALRQTRLSTHSPPRSPSHWQHSQHLQPTAGAVTAAVGQQRRRQGQQQQWDTHVLQCASTHSSTATSLPSSCTLFQKHMNASHVAPTCTAAPHSLNFAQTTILRGICLWKQAAFESKRPLKASGSVIVTVAVTVIRRTM